MANLKSISKGDKVILRLFTGAFVEAKEVEMADKTRIGFTNKRGIKMVFDKVTGKQIAPEPKSERFANYIEEWDEVTEKAELEKKSNKKKSAPVKTEKPTKSKKAVKAESVDDEEDIEEDEDDEDGDDFEEVE